jgi:hypothetical protein
MNDELAPELENDLDIDRRKIRDLQEAAKDRDKEHQKLKVASKSSAAPLGLDINVSSGSI